MQRQSRTAYVAPATVRVLIFVLSAFLVLSTVTLGAGTTPAVPSFTPSTISNGGCVYAYQVRAVDVTGDGFVDILAGAIKLGSCVFQWAALLSNRECKTYAAVGVVQLVKEPRSERTQ